MKKQTIKINDLLFKLRYAPRTKEEKILLVYAYELIKDFEGYEVKNLTELTALVLNGSKTWLEYSYNGCSLIYNEDIKDRNNLSTVKYNKYLSGSHGNDLLSFQANQLIKAYRLIKKLI